MNSLVPLRYYRDGRLIPSKADTFSMYIVFPSLLPMLEAPFKLNFCIRQQLVNYFYIIIKYLAVRGCLKFRDQKKTQGVTGREAVLLV
jgi:hypothetical protein